MSKRTRGYYIWNVSYGMLRYALFFLVSLGFIALVMYLQERYNYTSLIKEQIVPQGILGALCINAIIWATFFISARPIKLGYFLLCVLPYVREVVLFGKITWATRIFGQAYIVLASLAASLAISPIVTIPFWPRLAACAVPFVLFCLADPYFSYSYEPEEEPLTISVREILLLTFRIKKFPVNGRN